LLAIIGDDKHPKNTKNMKENNDSRPKETRERAVKSKKLPVRNRAKLYHTLNNQCKQIRKEQKLK